MIKFKEGCIVPNLAIKVHEDEVYFRSLFLWENLRKYLVLEDRIPYFFNVIVVNEESKIEEDIEMIHHKISKEEIFENSYSNFSSLNLVLLRSNKSSSST